MASDKRRSEETRLRTTTTAQQRFASWMLDVLVYTVVLNLFVEYVDSIVIDSFTISIFTAVLLKALLDVVFGFEHRVHAFFQARQGAVYRILGPLSMWAILFGSKFVILEAVDIVFGDHVELRGLVEIVSLIVAMIVAKQLLLRIYDRLGTQTA
ncbi:MAG: hypothetical protein ACE5MI_10960 [Acidimicrobiia bacterium]